MLGNLFIVGLTTTSHKILEKLILELHIGGITLYSRNYKNYDEMLELINYIRGLAKKANYNILICIDQEGGRVNRLPNEIVNIASPYSLRNEEKNLIESASITGEILKKSGIHLNFAPVLDIKRFPDLHAIGDRSFGTSKEEIMKNSSAYIKEIKKQGIIPVVKHFPGHGATKTNSHKLLPIIWDTKKLLVEDIIPFKQAISLNIDAIMVGHILVKHFCLFTPASLSKKMLNYLKDNLNFKGLIMTDDIDMGLLKIIPKHLLFKKAINNGVNIITVKYTTNFFENFYKLEKAYQKGIVNSENINLSLQKIEDLKIKYNVTNDFVAKTLNIEEINQRIKILNAKKISSK